MASSAAPRRHLASSPFAPDPEPVIEQYVLGDMVSHDAFGMGRVVNVESAAVTVDFGDRTARVCSPYAQMAKL